MGIGRSLRLGLALAALGAALALAACGSDGGDASSTSGQQLVPAGEAGDELAISQWPLYVDPGKDGTVAQFEGDTGIDVAYQEDINDNAAFFAKIQPLLQDGESGGRDTITVSDWLARQMFDLGYLYELDKSALPNVQENLIPALQHPAADPNRDFTVPWQAGMTGLIVRTDLAPGVDSICDLFDPEVRGQGLDAHRAARLGADDAQVHGHRSRHRDHRAVARRRGQDQRGR